MIDKANIIYIVLKIVKPNFENLGFLISNSGIFSLIPKRIILINNINETQHILAYFCIGLFLLTSKKKKRDYLYLLFKPIF